MDGHPIRVLLVDDQTMFLEGMSGLLAAVDGIDVVATATTAAEAQAAAQSHAPDVVLLDFGLPDGDGASVAEWIRGRMPATKVVMLTQFVDESIVLRAIDAGCSGYITKTEPVQQLVDAIQAAHAGEALIGSAMLARLLPRLRRTHRGLGSDLTPREREVLDCLGRGMVNQDIADELFVSLNTVRSHVQNILTKLGAHSKLEAAAIAVREGIITF